MPASPQPVIDPVQHVTENHKQHDHGTAKTGNAADTDDCRIQERIRVIRKVRSRTAAHIDTENTDSDHRKGQISKDK